TTRWDAICKGHLYAGAVAVFEEIVQDCKGPGPSISTTDYRHRNDGILGGAILVNEFVPIPIEAWSRLSTFDVVPAWGNAGLEAMRDFYSRATFVAAWLPWIISAATELTATRLAAPATSGQLTWKAADPAEPSPAGVAL